jgi:hypothetical protein
MDQDKSFAAVVRDAIDHVQEIIRSEIRLAKTELREEAGRAKQGAIYMGAAALGGLFAAGILLLAVIYLLAMFMPAWIAALIVGVFVGLVAMFLFSVGRRYFRDLRIVPERTAATLKEDVRWAQQRVR